MPETEELFNLYSGIPVNYPCYGHWQNATPACSGWVKAFPFLGGQFGNIALAWITLQVMGSGLAFGTVLMAAAIPNAVFMVFGGVMSDRFSPRWLMLISNISRCVIVAILALLVFLEAIELWHLYVMVVLFGFLGAFFIRHS